MTQSGNNYNPLSPSGKPKAFFLVMHFFFIPLYHHFYIIKGEIETHAKQYDGDKDQEGYTQHRYTIEDDSFND